MNSKSTSALKHFVSSQRTAAAKFQSFPQCSHFVCSFLLSEDSYCAFSELQFPTPLVFRKIWNDRSELVVEAKRKNYFFEVYNAQEL